MNRKKILMPLLAVLVLWMTFAANAPALSGAPAGMDQTKPAAAAPEVIRLPAGWQLNRMMPGPDRTEIALSPDGSVLVFSASSDGTMAKAMLFRRPLAGGEAAIIPGTEAACLPCFSPDGQWIAYWAKRKLNKVATSGGVPIPICDLKARPLGICWASDGRIIYGTRSAGLGSVSAAGGAPEPLTQVSPGKDATHRLPHLLPGGKSLLFTSMPDPFGLEARIEWLSLETGQRKVVMEDAVDARYASTGHLVFVRKGALMAAPFNLDRLEAAGPAVTVMKGIQQALNAPQPDVNSGAGQYTISETGTLVFLSGGIVPEQLGDLYWIDRGGRAEKWAAFGTRAAMVFRIAHPSGQLLAYASYPPNRGIGIYDIQKNTTTRVAVEGQAWSPIWTADGKRITFSWTKTGPMEIWWTGEDGGRTMELLTKSENELRACSWSPDGKYLAFLDNGPDMNVDIRLLRLADRQVLPFVATKSNEAFPDFSPDGRWLAYASNESGRFEIYIRSVPDGKRTLPITTEGGTAPLWSPDGRELFFWNKDFTKLMATPIVPGQNLSAGTPKLLFEYAVMGSQQIRNYDITPDGRRFLVRERKNYALPPVTELTLVRSWFEELKRLSPAGK